MSEPDPFAFGTFEIDGNEGPAIAAGVETGEDPGWTVANYIDSSLVALGFVDGSYDDPAKGIDKFGLVHPEYTRRAIERTYEEIQDRYGEDSDEFQVISHVRSYHGWDNE